MRLFVAINLNDGTRSKLVELRNDLRSGSRRGSFSRDENIHLTLVFLGECDPAVAKAAMDSVEFSKFDLIMDHIGRFRRDGGDIWWAGVRACGRLLELHKDLTAAMSAAGIETDMRAYDPHVTLGREIRTDAKPRNIDEFGETVNKIELMRSERIDGTLTYTPIHERRATS